MTFRGDRHLATRIGAPAANPTELGAADAPLSHADLPAPWGWTVGLTVTTLAPPCALRSRGDQRGDQACGCRPHGAVLVLVGSSGPVVVGEYEPGVGLVDGRGGQFAVGCFGGVDGQGGGVLVSSGCPGADLVA